MSSNYSEFNPYTIIADVIDFGILSADDFLVIERPNRRNRLAPYRQPPRQPSYHLPLLLPSPVLHPIFFPVYYPYYYFPHRYLYLPPPLHCQFAFNLPTPINRTIQIQEIDNLPSSYQSAREQIESGAPPVSTEPNSESLATKSESTTQAVSATDSGVSTDDEDKEDIKTPYQGNRRSFGVFSCWKCSRYWRSANTWANMWQSCFACLEHVYPRCQIARNMTNMYYHSRSNNIGDQSNAYLYMRNKQHPQQYCGMCQALKQNCRFLDYAPLIKDDN